MGLGVGRVVFLVCVAALFVACSDYAPPPVKVDSGSGDGQLHALSGATLRSEYQHLSGFFVSPLLVTDVPVHRTGFMIDLTALAFAPGSAPHIQARGFAPEQTGEWIDAETTWREASLLVARVDLGFAATAVQIRIDAADAEQIDSLRWAAVTLVGPKQLEAATSVSSQGLSATAADPADTLPRSAWEARATQCSTLDGARSMITIHHTVTPTTSGGSYERRLRAIQAFHMDVRGWCDIGYHYLVTADGRTFVGRPAEYRGAHVAGANSGNIGISFVGCFRESGCNGWAPAEPPTEMLVGAVQLIAALAESHGIDVASDTVLGHRDHGSAQTACPGENLVAKMQGIRNEVNATLAPIQVDPPNDPATDLDPIPPCGGLNYHGECDGAIVRWCEGDAVHEYDCGAGGYVCGWQNDDIGHNCLPSADPCQGIDYFGECDGNVLRWCQDNTLHTYDCSGLRRTCSWQGDQIGYNCI